MVQWRYSEYDNEPSGQLITSSAERLSAYEKNMELLLDELIVDCLMTPYQLQRLFSDELSESMITWLRSVSLKWFIRKWAWPVSSDYEIRAEEYHKTSVRVDGIPVKIQTGDFSNISQKLRHSKYYNLLAKFNKLFLLNKRLLRIQTKSNCEKQPNFLLCEQYHNLVLRYFIWSSLLWVSSPTPPN